MSRARRDRELESQIQLVWDKNFQHPSIRYTERLKDAGLEPSQGSVGDSYDNTLAER
jgi:transposase InsO family protein